MNQKTHQQTKQRRRFRNPQLHHNRWFIWAIVAIVLAGAGLTAYILISAENNSSAQVYTQLVQRPEYTNTALGFKVDYPQGWTIDNSEPGIVSFDNPQNSSEQLSVSSGDAASEVQLRKSVSIANEQDYTNDGLKIAAITAKPLKSKSGGLLMEIGIVHFPDGTVFYVTGQSAFFLSLVNTLRPL